MTRKCEMPDGTIKWYMITKKGSLLHKEDGPAVEYFNGVKEWWYENIQLKCNTQQEFETHIKLKSFW